MEIILKPFFAKYEQIVEMAEKVFDQVKDAHSDCVTCKVGCADCCHALFDLSLIEAMYINHAFNKKFTGQDRSVRVEKASVIDRKIYKIKRNAFKKFEETNDENAAMDLISKERMRCPLLDDDDKCEMYEQRPITCRLYGIPTSIGGRSHTCGLSGFKEGTAYPTVHLDKIHNALYALSGELVRTLNSRHVKMAELLVPLSMAVITDYDDEYLGIKKDGDAETEDKKETPEDG